MNEQESPAPKSSLFAKVVQPRFLLIAWLWAGGLFLAFLLVSSMVPKGKPGTLAKRQLLQGEMSDFVPAFPPRKATPVGFEGAAGQVYLGDFKGKVVIVNLWASWCTPCLTELPSLAKLQDTFPESVAVVPIAVENQPPEKLQQLLDRVGAGALPLYRDPVFTFAMTFGTSSDLPLTIIYDQKGKEIGRLTGAADWSGPEALDLIRAIIAGQEIG